MCLWETCLIMLAASKKACGRKAHGISGAASTTLRPRGSAERKVIESQENSPLSSCQALKLFPCLDCPEALLSLAGVWDLFKTP